MISEEKVRLMTAAALLEKKEERRAIVICRYRKKDYISFQMIKTWASYTAAYLIFTAVAFVWAAGGMTDSSVPELGLYLAGVIWVIGYLLCCAGAFALAGTCYSRRYRAAAVQVRHLRECLMALEDYYTERNSNNDSSAGVSTEDM